VCCDAVGGRWLWTESKWSAEVLRQDCLVWAQGAVLLREVPPWKASVTLESKCLGSTWSPVVCQECYLWKDWTGEAIKPLYLTWQTLSREALDWGLPIRSVFPWTEMVISYTISLLSHWVGATPGLARCCPSKVNSERENHWRCQLTTLLTTGQGVLPGVEIQVEYPHICHTLIGHRNWLCPLPGLGNLWRVLSEGLKWSDSSILISK
jgi:hypothetical protein